MSDELPHRGAIASRSTRLVLRSASEQAAAPLRLSQPAEAAYASLSFWAVPPLPEPAAASARVLKRRRRPFLLMPLNELNDEHYTVYFCKLQPGEVPANFCE